MKRFLTILTILIVTLSIGVFSFYYFGYYEKGTMSGRVMRISQKGVVFKTYEGKINLESFGALRGSHPMQEVFDFSVEKSETELIKELSEVARTGERVNLRYVKRYAKFFWRGDTKYFVDQVERTPAL
ncbi:MAG TPA: hypothetical protein VFD65_00880 [Chitinophagales bacterium]|nr:hypothetical protein [Chitinophagales bacterium]